MVWSTLAELQCIEARRSMVMMVDCFFFCEKWWLNGLKYSWRVALHRSQMIESVRHHCSSPTSTSDDAWVSRVIYIAALWWHVSKYAMMKSKFSTWLLSCWVQCSRLFKSWLITSLINYHMLSENWSHDYSFASWETTSKILSLCYYSLQSHFLSHWKHYACYYYFKGLVI
jgi:hypothetical protein